MVIEGQSIEAFGEECWEIAMAWIDGDFGSLEPAFPKLRRLKLAWGDELRILKRAPPFQCQVDSQAHERHSLVVLGALTLTCGTADSSWSMVEPDFGRDSIAVLAAGARPTGPF